MRPGMNGVLTQLSQDTIVKRLVHMCNANFEFNSLALPQLVLSDSFVLFFFLKREKSFLTSRSPTNIMRLQSSAPDPRKILKQKYFQYEKAHFFLRTNHMDFKWTSA